MGGGGVGKENMPPPLKLVKVSKTRGHTLTMCSKLEIIDQQFVVS